MATLHLVGTGTPTPTPQRFGTCHVLQTDGTLLMFDCGPAATHKLVQAGLRPTDVDFLFFTHHHSDHSADYPCFLLCRWDQSTGRENMLQVFGPPPTAKLTENLIGPDGAFAHDWKARVGWPSSQHVHVNRGGSLPRPGPVVEARDVAPGPVTEAAGCRVTAATALHAQPWLESLAYRVDAPGGSVTFTGDTEPCDTLAALAGGTDTLVTNCWDLQETMDANGESPGQTGTLEAAAMAAEAGASRLVLTHTGPALCEARDRAVQQIAEQYDGEIIFGEEGMSIELW